jgi:protein tyrosine phosphatase (PTP) superfamily phosphohydrolase (DUF442 family)
LLAEVVVSAQVGPADLMALDGPVFERIVEVLNERADAEIEEQRKADAKARHQERLKRLRGE